MFDQAELDYSAVTLAHTKTWDLLSSEYFFFNLVYPILVIDSFSYYSESDSVV